MRVCGIIAEYDPFHKGHLYHLEQARLLSRADYVICVISSAFTQRGQPALLSTRQRARMALLGGADVVLGMPVSYSCAQANLFALGGTGILDALGLVSHLCFGVEEAFIPHLAATAELMREPTEGFAVRLRQALDEGKSFARAQGEALSVSLKDIPAAAFRQPNFILALSYLLALRGLNSPMQALPVPRAGDYHARQLSAFPSASAARAALLRGDWAGLKDALPETSFRCLQEAVLAGELHRPGALDALLISRALSQGDNSGLAEMSEGLDRRIRNMAPKADSREDLAQRVKSKRYPYARVMRALSAMLLDMPRQDSAPPAYARLLGFRAGAEPLLKAIKQSGFPLVTRPARLSLPGLEQDMRAESLWYIGAGQPAEKAYRQSIMII